MGCLYKVGQMASDPASFWFSLECKIAEFEALGYPNAVLRSAAARMYARRGNTRWLRAKRLIGQREGSGG